MVIFGLVPDFSSELEVVLYVTFPSLFSSLLEAALRDDVGPDHDMMTNEEYDQPNRTRDEYQQAGCYKVNSSRFPA